MEHNHGRNDWVFGYDSTSHYIFSEYFLLSPDKYSYISSIIVNLIILFGISFIRESLILLYVFIIKNLYFSTKYDNFRDTIQIFGLLDDENYLINYYNFIELKVI